MHQDFYGLKELPSIYNLLSSFLNDSNQVIWHVVQCQLYRLLVY